MRIAHVSDIHWMTDPPARRLFGKRLLGAANLYLLGRRRLFSDLAQQRMVELLISLAPDALFVTGDLTATALPEEFAQARRALGPLLDTVPTLVVPGNHDVYTRAAMRERRLACSFGPWMGLDDRGVARLDVGDSLLIGLDPNRPGLLSSGRLPAAQLDRLAALLAEPSARNRTILLGLHYPVLDRRGRVYDSPTHGLVNAHQLLRVLAEAPAKPAAILSGHVHRGYTVGLDLGGTIVPVFCVGAGGAECRRGNPGAAVNVYHVAEGSLIRVERYLYDGARFEPEAGGPYAAGS